MIRIIDGVAYEGKSGDQLKLKAHDLGNGHLELTASRVMVWRELDWSPMVIQDHLDMMERYREEHADEVRQRHAEQSARRAKKRIRQLCKVAGVDTLLTLTYRANQTDLDLCKRHLKEFNRRMLRVFPGFSFVGGFEPQKRGAWHVHLCIRAIPVALRRGDQVVTNDRNAQNLVKVKSYDVIRAIWRSVVGDLGGNIDVAKRKRNSKRSPAQIAAYVAKYITKAFADGEMWSNRWTKYGKFDVPEPQDLGMVSTPLHAVERLFALVPEVASVAMARLDRWKDWFVLHAEIDPKKIGPSGGPI